MPDLYGGEYPITGTTEVTATATDDISFNFTGTGSERRYPCRSNSGAWDLCQDSTYGNIIDPIMRIDNTGNNAYTITMYINETMPTDFEIEINATTDDGAGETNDCGANILGVTGPNNISDNTQDASALVLVTAFPVASCFLNVSMWGYHEGTQPATEYNTNIITNSSV